MSNRRRHARSPAAGPLDDDDLLCEILLRLPPQPSSLPRASAVCRRWRRLVSDPGFSRRFRLRHRRRNPPPLLGFFDRFQGLSFLPTLEAPNRVPPGRFSLRRGGDDFDRSMSLGCRHGLFLVFLPNPRQVLVWDPVTGDKHRIDAPAEFDIDKKTAGLVNGAVLRPAGEDQHFQVVLTAADKKRQAFACVYSSKKGMWGDLISTPLPYDACKYVLMVDMMGRRFCSILKRIVRLDILFDLPVEQPNRWRFDTVHAWEPNIRLFLKKARAKCS